jgi:gliding motility-associated-like protein
MMKQKYILRFLLLAIITLGGMNISKATHIAGNEITIECIGQDSFLITLNLYRDCSGISAPTTASLSIDNSCGFNVSNVSLQLINPGGTEVSQLCASSIPFSTCNGGSLPGMQQYIYTGIVVLPGICPDWTFSWSSCCRNASVNMLNGLSTNNYIESTYDNSLFPCNNSPTFTSQPIPYVCQNQIVNYNFGVIDPDGDSLVYSFTDPLDGNGVPITWNLGYSATNPINGVVLDPTTGTLTFTPTILGIFNVAVQVCDYDFATGFLKSCITRDIQFVVEPCSNQVPLIDSNGITNFQGTGQLIGEDSIEVCVGNSFSFDILFYDLDSLDSIQMFTNVQSVLDSSVVVSVSGANPATMNISWIANGNAGPLNVFNVTAIDGACPTPGIVFAQFKIFIIPATYAGEDQIICRGTQEAQIEAIGGDTFTWSVIGGDPNIPGSTGDPITPANFSCNPCANPIASPNKTTTYEVVSNLSSGCKNIDTITIFVAPNFNLTVLPGDTTICFTDQLQIEAATDSNFTFFYNWSPSATLSADSISNPIADPEESTTYFVTVVSDSGCTKTGDIYIGLSPPFPENISLNADTLMCIGDTALFEVEFGNISFAQCTTSAISCGQTDTMTLGTGFGLNTPTTYPAIYGNWYWGARHQVLYTAAELNAMGMVDGGRIESIAWDVASIPAGAATTFLNFEIKMGCTSTNDMSTGWQSGLSTVYFTPAYTASTGWNTHVLNTNYEWDGVSNLVIEICFNNSSFTDNLLMRSSTTPFTSVLYYRADNATVCGSTLTTGNSNERPNMRMTYCTNVDLNSLNIAWDPPIYLSNPNSAVTQSYAPTTTSYNVIVSDTFGACADTFSTTLQVFNSLDASFSFDDPYCFTSAPDTGVPTIPGGIWGGAGIIDTILGVFDPSVVGIGTWPVTYAIQTPRGSCFSKDTGFVEVQGFADATVDSAEVCNGAPPITLTAATPGGIWKGVGIVDSINGVFNPNRLIPGYYTVRYEFTDVCYVSGLGIVKVNGPYDFDFIDNVREVCVGDSIILDSNFVLAQDTFIGDGPVIATWSSLDSTITNETTGVFDATGLTPGDYSVSLTMSDTNGNCSLTKSMVVRVRGGIAPVIAENLSTCQDLQSFLIQTTPSLFAQGVSFTTSQILSDDSLIITKDLISDQGVINPSVYDPGVWRIDVEYTNEFGCVATAFDTISIGYTPPAPTLIPQNFCEGDLIVLTANADNPDSLHWYTSPVQDVLIGTGDSLDYIQAPDFNTTPYVTVYVTEEFGACSSPLVTHTINVRPVPSPVFEAFFNDTLTKMPTSLLSNAGPVYILAKSEVGFLKANVDPNDSLFWKLYLPTDTTVTFTGTGPKDSVQAFYDAKGVYAAELTIRSEYGCQRTDVVDIIAIDEIIFTNVFTPNGDGVNDKFGPNLIGVTDRRLEIYDRWGNQVFTYDYPAEERGDQGVWDGKDQPDGTYFYIATYTDPATGQNAQKQGTVTLLSGQ